MNRNRKDRLRTAGVYALIGTAFFAEGVADWWECGLCVCGLLFLGLAAWIYFEN